MLDPSGDLAGGTTARFCTEGEGCGLPLVLLSAASHPYEKHLCVPPSPSQMQVVFGKHISAFICYDPSKHKAIPLFPPC